MSEYEYEDPGYDNSDDPDYGLLDSLYASDPAGVEQMVQDAISTAVEPLLVAQYGSEDYREQRSAVLEEIEQQAEAQAMASVAPIAEQLIREAGDEHDVRESAANGRLGEYADRLLQEAQYNAWASGDEELLASVSNAQAAEDAINLAGALLRDHAVKTRALNVIGSSRPGWDPVAKVWK